MDVDEDSYQNLDLVWLDTSAGTLKRLLQKYMLLAPIDIDRNKGRSICSLWTVDLQMVILLSTFTSTILEFAKGGPACFIGLQRVSFIVMICKGSSIYQRCPSVFL